MTRNAQRASALLLTAGLAVTLSPPASAADQPPTITSVTGASQRIADGACRDIPVSFRFDAVGWRVDGINAWISYKGERVGSVTANPEKDATVAKTTVRWCSSSPLGRFTAGPSTIYYRDPGGAGTKTVEDAALGSFYVRRASRTTIVSQAGSAVTTRLHAYSPTSGRFTPVGQVRVKLQRRAHGHWSTIDRALTDSQGRAVLHGAGGRIVSARTPTVARAKTHL